MRQKILKYIFEKYADGYGASTISKDLYALNIKPQRGGERWSNTTITGIIRNGKYYGDAVFGKTYTVDPISKKRVNNKGVADIYQFENHHEPIVSKELWDKANAMLEKRTAAHREGNSALQDFNGKYCMSFKIECGCCGARYNRRSHLQTTTEMKAVWKCATQTKLGRQYCPQSRTFDENAIQVGFVSALRTIVEIDPKVFDSILDSVRTTLEEGNVANKITNIGKSITALKEKQKKLIDLMLDGLIDKANYDLKTEDLSSKILEKEKEIKDIQDQQIARKLFKDKLEAIREKILSTDTILVFDPEVFSELIDRVIIGGKDNNGEFNPQLITYVFDMADSASKSKEYTVISEQDVKYSFWTFDLQGDGSRRKKKMESFPIRIGIKK